MPPVTSSKQLIWSQSKVCLEKLSVAGCEHLPYCAPQFGSTLPSICLGSNTACFPKKHRWAENPSHISAHHNVHILGASHWKQFFRLQCTILILSKELGVGSTSSQGGLAFFTSMRDWESTQKPSLIQLLKDCDAFSDKAFASRWCSMFDWLNPDLRTHHRSPFFLKLLT